MSPQGTRQFGIIATFHYTETVTEDTKSEFIAQFNPDNHSTNNWQYVSEVMVAQAAYDYITVLL